MPRRSKTDEELGFMRSFWLVVKGIESGHGKMVTLVVMPTSRQGVFSFRLSAMDLTDDLDGSGRTDMIQALFPNAYSASLAGFLWTQALKLEDMIIERQAEAAKGEKWRA